MLLTFRYSKLALLATALCAATSQAQDPAVSAAQATVPQATSPGAPQGAAPSTALGPSGPSAKKGEITGRVTSGKVPLPGVTVSAANSITGRRYITSTDVNGNFSLPLPAFGRYVVRADFAGFAAATKEIIVNAATPLQVVPLEMTLQSRVQDESGNGAARAVASGNARGMQSLSVTSSETGDEGATNPAAGSNPPITGAPSIMNSDTASESVNVAGNMGEVDRGFDANELRERIEDARARGESPDGSNNVRIGGGPGGGMGGGGPMIIMGPGMGGGRGLRNANFNQPHGTVFYQLGDSALDAAPYSLTGVPATKPAFVQNNYGALLGGALNIPHIYNGGLKTFFFIGAFGGHSSNPYNVYSVVPTIAERNGDFSQTVYTSGPNAGQPVTIYDPATHQPYAGNKLPSIDPVAKALLNYFPLPNQPGAQNFHFASSADTSQDTITGRIIHNFGSSPAMSMTPFGGMSRGGGKVHHNLNFGFSYQHSDNDLLNPFPALGGANQSHNLNVSGAYSMSVGRLNMNFRAGYNVGHSETLNRFAGNDIEQALGISGASPYPSDYGLPRISLSHYTGLSDTAPSDNDTQTFNITPIARWRHGKHNLSFGGDYHRSFLDLATGGNARGAYVFTGFATAGGPGTGYDLADFLLGLPQQTSVQYFNGTYHFRANNWSLFLQDDWRVRSNLTINAGLRYEYAGPYDETDNKLVNLIPNATFTAVQSVTAGTTGLPLSLVRPDRNNWAPRIGIAWKPFKKTVVRAGYGVNYNIGQYQAMVQQLGLQPPFAFTQTNVATLGLPLTLENGFPATTAAVTNSFAVNPNYRLGYVQNWNLNIQRELPGSIVLNVAYQGAKGTHLDLQRAPNRGPDGLRISGVQPFIYEDSLGDSIMHEGSVQLRKRLRGGVGIGGTYIYSKSIDNASSIGGGAVVVAQNDLDLAAERGLSSFDQRHRFTGDLTYELPFGENKALFNGDSWYDHMFSNTALAGSWTIASGLPFTARVVGDVTDVSRGTDGTLRADYVGGPIIGPQTIQEWFNTAAFVVPPPGTFGDAGRNTIEGPGTVLVNLSFSKRVQFEGMRAFEFRLTANNVLNHASFTAIDTVVNSPTFGQVTSVAAMRTITLMGRFQF